MAFALPVTQMLVCQRDELSEIVGEGSPMMDQFLREITLLEGNRRNTAWTISLGSDWTLRSVFKQSVKDGHARTWHCWTDCNLTSASRSSFWRMSRLPLTRCRFVRTLNSLTNNVDTVHNLRQRWKVSALYQNSTNLTKRCDPESERDALRRLRSDLHYALVLIENLSWNLSLIWTWSRNSRWSKSHNWDDMI
jgi:hypothetical protein